MINEDNYRRKYVIAYVIYLEERGKNKLDCVVNKIMFVFN